MIKIWIKRTLFGFLLFVAVVLALIIINSRDSATYDNHGFSEKLPVLPDSENGFSVIKYTQDKDGVLSDYEGLAQKLKNHIDGLEWDQKFVTSTLLEKSHYITDVEKVVDYPKFQLPQAENTTELPEYTPLLVLFRLVLLAAKQEIIKGNIDTAILSLRTALKFSQKVKTEENGYLISIMIGLVMQHDSLQKIHMLSNNSGLSLEQLASLQHILKELPDYQHDGFEKAFSGEFAFSISSYNELLPKGFWERLKEYKHEDDWIEEGDWDIPSEKLTLSREVIKLGKLFFPKFYTHKNESLGIIAEQFSNEKKRASEYCTYSTESSDSFYWIKNITWRDIFQPNSNGVRTIGDTLNYDRYFYRRCFGFAYIQAVKTIISIQRYSLEKGAYPESLEDLLPDYLDALPIDPFSGEALGYSNKNLWLYSVGANHEDNSGNWASAYHHHCSWDEQCANNPTFPVFAEFLGKDE